MALIFSNLQILEKVGFPSSKVAVDIQHEKHYLRVTSQIAERLKTQNLRKLESIRKGQKLSGVRAQSSFQEENFCNSGQKLQRSNYETTTFPVLLEFFTLFQIFCPGFLREQIFVYYSSQSPSNDKFLIFFETSNPFFKLLMQIQSTNVAEKFRIQQFSVNALSHV